MFWYGWSSKYLIHENEWRSCLGIGECVYRKHKETFPHFKALELKDGRQSWELQWIVSTFISKKRKKWGLIQCFGNFNECLDVNVVLFSIKLNKVTFQVDFHFDPWIKIGDACKCLRFPPFLICYIMFVYLISLFCVVNKVKTMF